MIECQSEKKKHLYGGANFCKIHYCGNVTGGRFSIKALSVKSSPCTRIGANK